MAFRNHLARGISAVAVITALAASATPAIAQEATVQPPTPVDEDGEEAQPVDPNDDNAIIVTGFRRSLETAVATKRESDLILESVTAEGIGKLPDDSIGESIARLPGVTSQRLNGRANVIAIRGLGPDFSQTLLNGREQTSTGDTRAVEFDQYPSEVVNRVNIYKTPSASLVGQGLVGTIDVRTIRPLEAREQVFAIGGSKSFVTSTQLKRFGVNGTVQWEASPTLMVTVDGFYSNFDDDQSKRGIELPLAFGGGFDVDPYDPSTGTTTTTEFGEFATSGTFEDVRGVVRNDVIQRKADLYSGGLNLDYEGDDGWSAFADFGYSRTDRNELSIESYSGPRRAARLSPSLPMAGPSAV